MTRTRWPNRKTHNRKREYVKVAPRANDKSHHATNQTPLFPIYSLVNALPSRHRLDFIVNYPFPMVTKHSDITDHDLFEVRHLHPVHYDIDSAVVRKYTPTYVFAPLRLPKKVISD